MISSKKIMNFGRKWQKQATNERKRIILWTKAEKGHFVVYSMDNKRFVLPLEYLKINIFRELFKLAEEEFGLCSNVPLMLPCDGTMVEYIITLIQRNIAKDLEEAVLMSITNRRCQSYLERTSQHLVIAAETC